MLEWLPRYEWRKCLVTDLIAGMTVGVRHIPQGMAYASLAALPTVYGLYTSLWPCILYPIFGVCAHCSIAPPPVQELRFTPALARLPLCHS
jgi:MFS superfamily sulfate permease-like transporter